VGNGNTRLSVCEIYAYDSQKIQSHALAITDHVADGSDTTANGGGTANVEEEETPLHPPATDEASVASISTTSTDRWNTSFKDISPLPLTQKPKPRRRKNTGVK
jgi:hypothetical protein